MNLIRSLLFFLRCLCIASGLVAAQTSIAQTNPAANAQSALTYVMGDSIANGLQVEGFAKQLNDRFASRVHFNVDGARSITVSANPGKSSGLQAVQDDRAIIAQAQVVVLVLGLNQMEPSFGDAQKQLMGLLKSINPKARYFWVDIGATIAPQAAGWSERNRLIYANASTLGYEVVSRYQAIFGPDANPLRIEAGRTFADWPSEPGFGGPGNIHGFSKELAAALVEAIVPKPPLSDSCKSKLALNAYVLGDSISYGLQYDGFADKLHKQIGGNVAISFDAGRSITQPGTNIRKSALQSVHDDRAKIAKAQIIVIVLGTNQSEASFEDAQRELLQLLRTHAPAARYFWVDIGATIASQAKGWSARNSIIHGNAQALQYTVVSRYKAIFGPQADPLNIVPGKNFPGWISELGFDTPGNVHGMQAELSRALLNALPKPLANVPTEACS